MSWIILHIGLLDILMELEHGQYGEFMPNLSINHPTLLELPGKQINVAYINRKCVIVINLV
jgi:hypothetical protein